MKSYFLEKILKEHGRPLHFTIIWAICNKEYMKIGPMSVLYWLGKSENIRKVYPGVYEFHQKGN